MPLDPMQQGGMYSQSVSFSLVIDDVMVVSCYRPVRMHMDLDTNMKLIGKRYPYLATYEVHTRCLLCGVLVSKSMM